MLEPVKAGCRASHELRDVLSLLRDLIDNTSVADIASMIGPPHAAGACKPDTP